MSMTMHEVYKKIIELNQTIAQCDERIARGEKGWHGYGKMVTLSRLQVAMRTYEDMCWMQDRGITPYDVEGVMSRSYQGADSPNIVVGLTPWAPVCKWCGVPLVEETCEGAFVQLIHEDGRLRCVGTGRQAEPREIR
jgi:hypothetical protein